MRRSLILTVSLFVTLLCVAQAVKSPNGKLKAVITCDSQDMTALSVYYCGQKMTSVKLGVECNGESYAHLSEDSYKKRKIDESYIAIHGKRSVRENHANELSVLFNNEHGKPLMIIVRTYNDGVCFRYALPQSQKGDRLTAEYTDFDLSETSSRWQQRYITCYEGDYPVSTRFVDGHWGFPLLARVGEKWMLLSEADIDRHCCATHLRSEGASYYVAFPFEWEGNNTGQSQPTLGDAWQSPWRVMIIGTLATIVESTLVEDVCPPSCIGDASWIKPGRASWVYWAYNRGTKDYQICCRYVDLAAEMGWEYVLFDWEWDQMTNGGTLRDAATYALSRGVKPLLWYNSGGEHTRVMGTPRDRMISHESRMKEFRWLKEMGFAGVKVDFFESDKQNMMNYYLDILKDAASMQMMVDFHGCTIPRGWSRTYPNLISMEAVFGAEQYNNSPRMTPIAARLNCTLPFIRNVVGPMDYTPVAFTNSQHPHITTDEHELALAVVFESAIQHWADRPEGFLSLSKEKQDFMRNIPVAWDDTKLIGGYPGRDIVIARCKGNSWYVAALNGEDREKQITIDLSFLRRKPITVNLKPRDGYTMIINNK